MRILTSASAIAVIGTILLITPAAAQTYDPSYPVCLHEFGGIIGGGDYHECRYTSIAQCKASASGRAAMCEVNPFFDPAYRNRDRNRRRPD